jgi:hypothetical protein
MKTSNTTRLGALALGFVLLSAFTADKLYILRFSEESLNKHFNNLSAIKAVVEKSNLPHQEVLFVVSSIDSLQKAIVEQVKEQPEAAAPKK